MILLQIHHIQHKSHWFIKGLASVRHVIRTNENVQHSHINNSHLNFSKRWKKQQFVETEVLSLMMALGQNNNSKPIRNWFQLYFICSCRYRYLFNGIKKHLSFCYFINTRSRIVLKSHPKMLISPSFSNLMRKGWGLIFRTYFWHLAALSYKLVVICFGSQLLPSVIIHHPQISLHICGGRSCIAGVFKMDSSELFQCAFIWCLMRHCFLWLSVHLHNIILNLVHQHW